MPNDISIGSAVSAQLTSENPYTLQQAAPFSLQNCPFASGPPSKSWFLGCTRVYNPWTWHVDWFSGFCRAHNLDRQLECGPMPNVMVALLNIGDALCSMPQSLADAHYLTAMHNAAKTQKPLKLAGVPQTTGSISGQSSPYCGDV